MHIKWKMFLTTFFIYAIIHSVRTAWSSMKYFLNSAPFKFSPIFLGTMDMIALFTLAISLNVFGPKIEKYGPKRFLQLGIVALLGCVLILSFFLLGQLTVEWPYLIFYAMVGAFSCVGWPVCLFVLSKYVQKGMAFSIWHGTIQFGDFFALFASYLLMQIQDLNGGFLMLLIAFALVLSFIVTHINLPLIFHSSEKTIQLPEESPVERNASDLVQQNQHPISDSKLQSARRNQQNQSQQVNELPPVTFMSVWLLPGVPGYLFAYCFVKSVNSIIITWLVFYMALIGMNKEARIIAALWSVSTFFGGLLGSFINPTFKRWIFIISLFISSLLFAILEGIQINPNQIEISLLIFACGLSYGGPYTLMGTSIPVLLSQNPQISKRKGVKATIISTMQGFGLFIAGISLLVVPTIGVIDLHWVVAFYCSISAIILIVQMIRQQKDLQKKKKKEKQKQAMENEAKKQTPRGKDLQKAKEQQIKVEQPQAFPDILPQADKQGIFQIFGEQEKNNNINFQLPELPQILSHQIQPTTNEKNNLDLLFKTEKQVKSTQLQSQNVEQAIDNNSKIQQIQHVQQ